MKADKSGGDGQFPEAHSRNLEGMVRIATVFTAIVIDQRHDPLTVQTGGRSDRMMRDMMSPDMMWGMGAFDLLGVTVLVLVIAALIKYLFFRLRPNKSSR